MKKTSNELTYYLNCQKRISWIAAELGSPSGNIGTCKGKRSPGSLVHKAASIKYSINLFWQTD
jgi:hypothetical protein